MKLVRKLHLYLGCFFSPLLLLFIGTGWRQTMSPHKKLTNSLPDKLSSIHLNQTFPAETGGAYSPQLFQYLVVGMCVALIFTILLGIFSPSKPTNANGRYVCRLYWASSCPSSCCGSANRRHPGNPDGNCPSNSVGACRRNHFLRWSPPLLRIPNYAKSFGSHLARRSHP